MPRRAAAAVEHISEPTNGAENLVDLNKPYLIDFEIEGACDMLFKRWNCESVEEKAKAPKNSKIKKTDDVETYVWRDDNGYICLPGAYVKGSMVTAAKSESDPRSPRKSAADLFKAGIVPITQLASLGTKKWDYLDTQRVQVQRQAINRTRPAFKTGWRAKFTFQVIAPQYITADLFYTVLQNAGQLAGVADYRPTYGRFKIINWNVRRA